MSHVSCGLHVKGCRMHAPEGGHTVQQVKIIQQDVHSRSGITQTRVCIALLICSNPADGSENCSLFVNVHHDQNKCAHHCHCVTPSRVLKRDGITVEAHHFSNLLDQGGFAGAGLPYQQDWLLLSNGHSNCLHCSDGLPSVCEPGLASLRQQSLFNQDSTMHPAY